MPSQQLLSSVIKTVSHSEAGLTIEFKKTGSRFRYLNVPFRIYMAICSSSNPGAYYIQHIKGKYFSKKLNKNQL